MMKYKIGDCVEINGSPKDVEATILNYYADNMYTVRLWSGFRHIGDVAIDKKYIKLIKGVNNETKINARQT